MENHLEVLASCEGEFFFFFCLGGVLEQNSDHRPAEKEGLEYPEWVLLVQRRGGNY